MELLTIFRVLARRWWLIAIPVIIATVFAVPDVLNRRAISGGYTVSIRYTAAQDYDALPRPEGDYQDIWLSSELTVNAFTDWVRGNRFLREAADLAAERGVNIDPASIRVSADNERSLGQIIFGHDDAEALAAFQQAAVEVLRTRSQDFFAQLGGAPASVSILDLSPITPAPPPLIDRYTPLLRVGLAFIAGCALALLAHYLDPALRRREDVEALGLRVIAHIPRHS